MAILDVIKYEGDNNTFVWKHPTEDFNTVSQLIVHESQQAIFFYEGKVQQVFGPGRYELNTKNYPFITALVTGIVTGGVTPFHAEVYFVNLTEQMGIPWGTASKVVFMEPTYGFPLEIGASGEMGLKVIPEAATQLVIRLVGTEAMASQDGLLRYFRSFLQTRVKVAIAEAIKEQHLSIFEMDLHLAELSGAIGNKLAPDFAAYGLALTQFMVTSVVRPDGDREYERFKELYFRQYADIREAEIRQQVAVIDQTTEAKRTVIDSQAQAQKRQIEGYTYQQERGFDVAEKVASNEGVGEFSNLGVGLGVMGGVGMGLGGAVADSLNGSIGTAGIGMQPAIAQPTAPQQSDSQAAVTQPAPVCPGCGAEVKPTWKLCPECGEPLKPPVCANCGAELKPTWKLCPECGTPR